MVAQTRLIVTAYVHCLYNDWLRGGRSGDRIPVEAKFSAPAHTSPGFHPASCTMRTESFSGLKSGRGVTLTPHPFQCHGQERVELYLYSPMDCTACTEPQCLYKCELYTLLSMPFSLLCSIPRNTHDRTLHRDWRYVRN